MDNLPVFKRVGLLVSNWYAESHRDLPWRRTVDPWAILVSEIMLQQTRVESVIDYYHRFINRFPTPAALASAEEEEILHLWKGLGYYSRARNLKKAAELLISRYGGCMPVSPDKMRVLPGVGAYTAGAVLSIAFNLPVPAIDGNVLRVMARWMADVYDIGDPKAKVHFEPMVRSMIPEMRAHDFCQGMMELGATTCVPSTPKCSLCPIRAECQAYMKNRTTSFPIKRKKVQPTVVHWHTYCIRRNGFILLESRGEGLLQGMVGLPQVESESDVPDPEAFWERYGLYVEAMAPIGQVQHVFTHRKWRMQVWEATIAITASEDFSKGEALEASLFWHAVSDTSSLAIPTAFQKVLDLL